MGRSRRRNFLLAGALASFAVLVALALFSAHIPPSVAAAQTGSPAASAPVLNHPDQQCRGCHQAVYDSYQHTPMALGSGDAVQQLETASPGPGGFTQRASGVRYEVSLRNGHALLSFRRPAEDGRAALEGEHQLLYFVGSGRRGRTYLYQQDHLWFEAPINWYGKKQVWDMAPAFEDSTVMPAPLPVDANCLHCHAGEVQTATGGARNHFPGAPFRSPGVGCAACHGDPSAHLATAGKVALGTHPGTILNPADLDPARRVDVCLQCHLEGDATVYRPGKSLAGFRPGELLSDSAVYFVDRTRAQQGRRATSQYEALLRSACKRGAGDRLTCTTCHDPHSSPAPAERVAFFRGKCLSCHTGTQMATRHHPEQQNCAACHMPTRKTLDISHEQLTDHDIEARPSPSGLLKFVASTPDLVPVGAAEASQRELGLAYAQLAQRGDRGAAEKATRLLLAAESTGSNDFELHNELGFLLQVSGDRPGARREYEAALRERPQDTTAAANLAVIDAQLGRGADALRLLRQTFAEDPSQTAVALNLAFLDCRVGNKAAALQVLQQALRFDPDSPEGRAFLATGSYNGQSCPLH